MNNRQSVNSAPDDSDNNTRSAQPSETHRQSDNDRYTDSQDGYDDGLVHSHGWAVSER